MFRSAFGFHRENRISRRRQYNSRDFRLEPLEGRQLLSTVSVGTDAAVERKHDPAAAIIVVLNVPTTLPKKT